MDWKKRITKYLKPLHFKSCFEGQKLGKQICEEYKEELIEVFKRELKNQRKEFIELVEGMRKMGSKYGICEAGMYYDEALQDILKKIKE